MIITLVSEIGFHDCMRSVKEIVIVYTYLDILITLLSDLLKVSLDLKTKYIQGAAKNFTDFKLSPI